MKQAEHRRAYHHGDLQRALLDAAMRLLGKRPDGDIGLREVARATGVSATAVYRHFPDKDALMAALAARGFAQLAETQRAAASRHAHAGAAFRAIGQAYVHFAVAHPALFGLMARHMRAGHAAGAADNPAARLLEEQVAALAGPDADPSRLRVTALQAWALVHGLAVLILGGQIPHDPELVAAVVDEFRPNPEEGRTRPLR